MLPLSVWLVIYGLSISSPSDTLLMVICVYYWFAHTRDVCLACLNGSICQKKKKQPTTK